MRHHVCPHCGNDETMALESDHSYLQSFLTFRFSADRECVCGTIWRPGCPRWAAWLLIVAGLTGLALLPWVFGWALPRAEPGLIGKLVAWRGIVGLTLPLAAAVIWGILLLVKGNHSPEILHQGTRIAQRA